MLAGDHPGIGKIACGNCVASFPAVPHPAARPALVKPTRTPLLTSVAAGRSSASAAGLRYGRGDEPGFTRVRRGNGFAYRTIDGKAVRDARTLKRIRALVLPPAWTNVWIARDPRAHLQATGRDAAGRKQYRYHPQWTAERDSTKYHRMLAFAQVLPAVRRRCQRDLRSAALSRPRVLATVVTLLERTHIRIGNEEYARRHRSHGLTTLRDRHVKVRGRHVRFAFRAKSGVHQAIDVEDPHLARAVRECQDLPGQMLFQYRDEAGAVKCITSSDVNTYLREITGGEFTAKDFRTWAGTLAAAQALDEASGVTSIAASRRTIVAAVDQVADALGNTRAVARKCYIHPAVIDAYSTGLTVGAVSPAATRAYKALRRVEGQLVALLQRMSQKREAA
jgi:DNA topoisomerase-1